MRAARSTAIRIPITSSPFQRNENGIRIIPSPTPGQSDLSIAVAAAQAAARAAEAARDAPLRARTKGVAPDRVPDADGGAELAAAELRRRHRPDDAIVGRRARTAGPAPAAAGTWTAST